MLEITFSFCILSNLGKVTRRIYYMGFALGGGGKKFLLPKIWLRLKLLLYRCPRWGAGKDREQGSGFDSLQAGVAAGCALGEGAGARVADAEGSKILGEGEVVSVAIGDAGLGSADRSTRWTRRFSERKANPKRSFSSASSLPSCFSYCHRGGLANAQCAFPPSL